MKKKISKANKPNKPNVYLSDRTKRRVMSKTYYAYKTYDEAAMMLCNKHYKLIQENNALRAKSQQLTEALKNLMEAIDCCQGCNK